MSRAPLKNPVKEGLYLVEAAGERNLVLRLLGGVAIKLHSGDPPGAPRGYADIDLITDRKSGDQMEAFMEEMGYTPNRTFNTYNGDVRQLYYDEKNGRQVDFFVGDFKMCHQIPFKGRLEAEPYTVPRAELLLTKIQIVEMNPKDVQDLCQLFLDNEVTGDDSGINAERTAELCSEDWGLYQTFRLNTEKILEQLKSLHLERESKRRIQERISKLLDAVEEHPKKVKWKLRAVIGERLPWYDLPEEVQR